MSILNGLWELSSDMDQKFPAESMYLMFLPTGDYALIKKNTDSIAGGVEVGKFSVIANKVMLELTYDGLLSGSSNEPNEPVLMQLDIVDLSHSTLIADFGAFSGVEFRKVQTTGTDNIFQQIWRLDTTTYGDSTQLRQDVFGIFKPDGEFFVIDPPYSEFGPNEGPYTGLEYGQWIYREDQSTLEFTFEYNGTYVSPEQDSGLSNRGPITILKSAPEFLYGKFDSEPEIYMKFSRVGEAITFENRIGNDTVKGSKGVDRIIYDSAINEVVISKSDNKILVSSGSEVDTLENCERILFSDTSLALDYQGTLSAGAAYRLYQAAFDRQPDLEGLGYWINEVDNGISLEGMAYSFIDSPEFRSMYGGSPSNQEFVTLLYNNVLNRNPDEGGFNYWINEMNNGLSRAGVLSSFSESSENQLNVIGQIENGFEYTEWIG